VTLIVLLALAIVFIVAATVKLKLHPFLALLLAAFGYGLSAGMPLAEVVKSVNSGFGDTIGAIGIVILAGSIIGTMLERSGGAYGLAERVLRITGPRRLPLAMTVVGYTVSIPVFCDSAFILLSPLSKALARKAGVAVVPGAVALSLGLYSTHTMVPPTPGPVSAAGVLGADLGLVIAWGLLVSAVASLTGWLFATFVAGRVPSREGADASASVAEPMNEDRPSVAKALIPILLPIVLIVLRSVAELPASPLGTGPIATLLVFLGQPVVALLLGAFTSFLLPKSFSRDMWSASGWVGEAVVAAGAIIVITGAGGSFGSVLKNSGIGDVIAGNLAGREGIGIVLPFLIAAGLKTAQGSSTVAMITTASLVLPLLPALGLEAPAARALAVVAIGAGSMVVSHANDSYFWVVTQFSNMSVNEGYRLQTLGSLLQGLAAGIAVWILAALAL
jgi:GntP family gluconate:H+ symporter